MDDLKNNKIFLIVISLITINLLGFAFSKFIINATTGCVIEKLKQNYSPSPYGPGFDPDKVNPDSLKVDTQGDELYSKISFKNDLTHGSYNGFESWQKDWEQDRGFNPTR
jgi:hypothetical protein